MSLVTQNRPQSSPAEIASVVVQAYAARQTEKMNKTLGDLSESSRRIEGHLHRTNSLLQSMNEGIQGLELGIRESNAKLERAADAAEKQLLLSQIEAQKSDLRYEQEQLEKAEQKTREETEQNLKDLLHNFNRRTSLIHDSDLTNVEKVVFLGHLKDTISAIDGTLLSQLSDKEYRDKTEDLVNEALDTVKASLGSQDQADLELFLEIEAVDENKLAENLLLNLEEELSAESELTMIKKELKFEFANGLTNTDLKRYSKRLKKLEKAVI
jgi:hypothetical protein